MLFKLLLAVFLINFNLAKVANTEEIWFLDKQNLFYANMEQSFDSFAAQRFCIEKDMTNIIETSELKQLIVQLLLNKKYENSPILWILDGDSEGSTSSNDCYAMSVEGIRPNDCLSLNGVICKTRIMGAAIQYKNGTFFEVDTNGANQFCNPRSEEYDNDLEYCLIEFDNSLPM